MTDRGYGHGLVLGKFMPAHLGHAHLIRFACAMCERVTVVVDRVAGEWPDAADRAAALRQDCAGLPVTVVALPEPTPQQPQDHPAFWSFWRDTLRVACGGVPDALACAVEYGVPLAQAVGCTLLPLDIAREAIPLCATAIRADPWGLWDRMLPHARGPYSGPGRGRGPGVDRQVDHRPRRRDRLRVHLCTGMGEVLHRAERAAGTAFTEPDLLTIARGHCAAVRSLELVAHQALIADTSLLTTLVWGRFLYGRSDARIEALFAEEEARAPWQRWFFTPDTPWVADTHRDVAADRRGARDPAALLGPAGGGGGAPWPALRDRPRRVRRQAGPRAGAWAGAPPRAAAYRIGCV